LDILKFDELKPHNTSQIPANSNSQICLASCKNKSWVLVGACFIGEILHLLGMVAINTKLDFFDLPQPHA
jgi:hypothetical protein